MARDLGRALAVHCRLSDPQRWDLVALVADEVGARLARLGCLRCHGRGADCCCDRPCGRACCLGGL